MLLAVHRLGAPEEYRAQVLVIILSV